MTAESTMRDRLRQPWLIRRIFYLVMAAVGVAAAVLGVSMDRIDSVTAALEPAIAVVLTVVSALAASKANPGSDVGDPAPVEIREPAPAVSAQEIVAAVLDRLIPAGQHRADSRSDLDTLRDRLAVED